MLRIQMAMSATDRLGVEPQRPRGVLHTPSLPTQEVGAHDHQRNRLLIR